MVHGIEPIEPPDVTPPLGLEFEREGLKIGVGKRRTVELRAPTASVGRTRPVVDLHSTDAGIVLRRSRITLEHGPDLGFYLGAVRIEGRALGASG